MAAYNPKGNHEDHPGHDAPDCSLRRTVNASPTGTSRHGYGCFTTGGHCLPGPHCEGRRTSHEEKVADGSLQIYPAYRDIYEDLDD